ncbi:restriction endonuclease subunit S, partial [Thiolapillus sp.]|uniref:restriction endonuclease subunit S n=1 Tax=Thiolapillus sp. TaxID=2017437 RepID=UPI003AF9C153
MSSKSDKKKPLVPSLRFPEFREAGAWEVKRLGDIASIIQDKVGRKECILLSVTSGIGLVSQVEKFGREIASNQRKNYFAIRSNDFAYNKSATKNYPQGFIGLYKGDKLAGVPNSIFICFRPNLDEVVPSYLDYLFSANLHGKQLNRFITVGARAHGSLNVDNKDLLSIPIPIPMNDEENGQVEQQKIAHCLSSLDEVIGLQAKKVQALKQHKKGLMQQLFPAEGETTPRLRFPDFREAGAWEVKRLGEVCDSFSGGTPTTTKKQYYGGSIPFIR